MEEVRVKPRRRLSFLCTPLMTIHPLASSRTVMMARHVPTHRAVQTPSTELRFLPPTHPGVQPFFLPAEPWVSFRTTGITSSRKPALTSQSDPPSSYCRKYTSPKYMSWPPSTTILPATPPTTPCRTEHGCIPSRGQHLTQPRGDTLRICGRRGGRQGRNPGLGEENGSSQSLQSSANIVIKQWVHTLSPGEGGSCLIHPQ